MLTNRRCAVWIKVLRMIRIEQATTDHIPQMADLLAVLFSEEAEFRPDREKQIRGLRMIIGAPERGNIFVATEEDEVVGMVSLLFTISTAKGAPGLLAGGHGDPSRSPRHGHRHAAAAACRRLRQVARLHPHHAA